MGGLFLFSTLELPRIVGKGKRKGKMESKERKERKGRVLLKCLR